MIKRFMAYYRPHLGLFTLDFGCAVLAGLMELGFPIAIRSFVDKLLPTGNWHLIVLATVGLAAVYLFNTGLMAVVTYWGHALGTYIETELRRRAFEHVQKLSFRFFDTHKTGVIVGRLTKDLEEIGEIAHHGPEDTLIAVMTFIGAFIVMLWVHVPLALITAAVVPGVAWATGHFGRRMHDNSRDIFSRVGEFNVRIEENVGGMRVVQAFTNEAHENRLFARNNNAYRNTKLEGYRIMAMTMAVSYLSMRLILVLVMIAGAYFVLRGELTTGGFFGYLLLVNVFFRPIEKINAVIETYPRGTAGFRRYLDLLDTEPDVADRPGAVAAPPFEGGIRYRNVTFGYDSQRPVLKDFSLTVEPGQTVALVGPSGAGKTTVCSLLPRFYDVLDGAVEIDGIDVRALTLASLRAQIGIVQQDVYLFGGSIRENIAYGRLDASDEAIWEAARRARLDRMIRTLPEGMDTVVGERGVRLSGGQKQRLSIARMFLKNPRILILDEATSALDTQTEREIQASLAELAVGRTSLVIAHRLATIRDADLIVEIGADNIVRRRSYDELIGREAG